MFWKTAYEKFLEGEVDRLRAEYDLLLSALLERAGHLSAAQLLRGSMKNPSDPELIQKAQVRYDENQKPKQSYRARVEQASRDTLPKIAHDSAEALEQRIEERKAS